MFRFPEPIGTNRHENDVAAILARIERLGVPARPVAFYGSSSFRFWGSMAEDLGSLDVVNLGFGGGTFLSALHYFDQLLLPARPARVALYFGENDIASDGLTAETTVEHLTRLLDRIEQALPGMPVFVLSVKHGPARWIYADEFDHYNRLGAAICNARPQANWVEIGAGLMGANGRPMSRHFMPDMIHLNASGYAVWASVLRGVEGLL